MGAAERRRAAAPAGEAGGVDAAEEMLAFGTQVLIAGLSAIVAELPPPPPEGQQPPPDPTPQQTYEAAEAALRDGVDLRKRAQQRVRGLEREEAALRKARDRAKEYAKAWAKQSRSQG
jgi:hypothetical protein